MNSELLFVLMLGCSLAVAWGITRNKRLKIITVIDGDTYEAVSASGRRYRLRLKGCDCPEMDQQHGAEAAAFVRERLQGKWVSVRFMGKDRYRRYLVRIAAGGQDLAEALLGAGLAFPLEGFSTAAALARFGRKGVWAAGGRRQKPWEARSRRHGTLSWMLRRTSRKLRQWSVRG